MLFSDLLRATRALPREQWADAETDLRALRIWRLLMWAPAGRGKSTLMRGLARTLAAPFRVLSIDSDQVDGENVERLSLPGFNSQATFAVFCREFQAKLNTCEPALRTGKIAGVALDTITTIQTALAGMLDLATAFTQTPQASLDHKRQQANVLVSMAAKVCGMSAAAMASPLDAPIVLAVTEHARSLSDDYAWKGWCPRIGANGGEQISALFDAMIAVGLEPPNQLEALRHAIVWTGRADVKVRLSADEVPIWESCMSMRDKGRADPTRIGVAMVKIWEARKARWVQRWLVPADLRSGPDAPRLPADASVEVVLQAALAMVPASAPAEVQAAAAEDEPSSATTAPGEPLKPKRRGS